MVDENKVNKSHPNSPETGCPKPDDKGDDEASQITKNLTNLTSVTKTKEATKNFWDLIVEVTNDMNWEVE